MVSIWIAPKGKMYAKILYSEISHEELLLLKFPHEDTEENTILCDLKENWDMIILIALRSQRKEKLARMREAEGLEVIRPLSIAELQESDGGAT